MSKTVSRIEFWGKCGTIASQVDQVRKNLAEVNIASLSVTDQGNLKKALKSLDAIRRRALELRKMKVEVDFVP